jgi:hypothetical protein
MVINNRGGSSGSNRGRDGRNNNPEGRNQYSGVIGTARGNPLATAAVAGGALAAGVFLWSRRNEISDQISSLADQISEWREGMAPDGDRSRSQTEISEEALTLKETGKAV